MNLKRAFMILVIILAFAALAACVRSIPTEEVQEPTATVLVPVGTPSGATEIVNQLYLFATQTVAAQLGFTAPPPTVIPTKGPEMPATGEVASLPQDTSVPEAPTPGAEVVQPSPVPTEMPAAAPTEAPEPTREQVVVPTATPGKPQNYTLHTGEFPFCIARRFDVDPNQLLIINGMTVNSMYYAGMTLRIPQSGSFPGARALRKHPATYTVTSGDTMYSVACLFGDVDPEMIAYANGYKSADAKLKPGEEINIP